MTVEVTADGDGLVSHAGSALLARVADKTGLTRALSREARAAAETAWQPRRARHRPRARGELAGAPERVMIDLDATLLTAHSDKEGAAPSWKRGYAFHPMLASCDQSGEALAGELRPGNAGAGTAADQIAVAEQALRQIPHGHIEDIKIMLRVDSAGACHELLDWCREARIGYSVGFDLTEPVRAAIERIADAA